MHSDSVTRRSRVAVAAFAAVSAALAAAAVSAAPAYAQTGSSLSLSPSSGSDFTSDAATLSWTLPSACVGNEVDTFIYKGTGAWNAAAINTAEGNNGGQTTYYDFYDNVDATSATGSTNWPNVSSGYTDYGTQTTPAYTSTGALVAAEGTGYYTLAIACVSPTTFEPITDSSGAPLAAYTLVDVGATGNSWAESSATATQVALTGVGTAGKANDVALKATVTASDGSVPAGGVNFYTGTSATGTPVNGSTPVQLSSKGVATYAGNSGYSGQEGAQEYTAQFVPSNPADYVSSSVTTPIDLIAEAVGIDVTAQQDSTTPSSLDVTATAEGVPTSLSTAIPGGGVDFIIDGTVYSSSNDGFPAPFTFNSNGEASATITGLPAGSHTVTVQLADASNDPLGPSEGYAVAANTASASTS
jgi:hypothetical protein